MVFRLPPAMDVSSYKTYQIRQDKRQALSASCEAVECEAYRNGWVTALDESTDLGRRQADYIRTQSKRYFVETRDEARGLTEFQFPSDQKCFAQHSVSPSMFMVRDGDWRGNPTNRQRLHTQGKFWVEDFAEHQAKLAEQIEKG